jgi:hypothetical protein
MKKVILFGITLICFFGYVSVAQCQVDQWGNIRLCPIRPYTLVSFFYTDPPTNQNVQATFTVCWKNNGTATAYNLKATISCYPPGDISTDPDITIGTVPPGATVCSSDTFELNIDLTLSGLNQGVCWQATYDDAAGNQYVVTDIAKFCGEVCCEICDCTVITLDSFTAVAGNKNVTLTWETATENDNIGFNIYRTESKNGKYVKINSAIIPAQGSAFQGAKYTYIDNTAKNRKTYYYKLEDLDVFGTPTLHGPYSATPRLIFGLFKW